MLENYFQNFIQSIREETKSILREELTNEIKKILSEIKPKQETILLSRKEVCKALAISEPTLDGLVKSGVIPCHRIGKSIRFKKEEVENSLIKRKF